MVNLIIASSKNDKVSSWLDTLEPLYLLSFVDDIDRILLESQTNKENSLLVLDASLLTEKHQLALICESFYKVLVINEGRNSGQKIQYIYDGAWGYSDYSVSKQLMIRAIESILNNEVWLERQLIPQLLQGAVARSSLSKVNDDFSSETLKLLSTLTHREIEVIKLAYAGRDNIAISQALNISNRTVKAHLSAVYRKLDVSDRFQLIVFLKNLDVGHFSSVHDFFEVSEQLKLIT
ncbi:MAG: hypothetical protein GQ529_01160 [Methyloprofundus sp.]|nr:hypothetical protein [Methyloprofundus sp.]